jgi:hypothetical protein
MIPLLALGATQQAAPTPTDEQNYRAAAETMITKELKDPDSAKFSWPNGFVQGLYKSQIIGSHFTRFHSEYGGWITCGTVNAKNGYGGYDGPTAVIVVGQGYSVAAVDMDEPADRFRYVAEACRRLGFPGY